MTDDPATATQVEIFSTHALGERAVVFGRMLDQLPNPSVDSLLLNGAQVAKADLPRALDASGHQRYDLWGFWLKNASDLNRFCKGQIVELEVASEAQPD